MYSTSQCLMSTTHNCVSFSYSSKVPGGVISLTADIPLFMLHLKRMCLSPYTIHTPDACGMTCPQVPVAVLPHHTPGAYGYSFTPHVPVATPSHLRCLWLSLNTSGTSSFSCLWLPPHTSGACGYPFTPQIPVDVLSHLRWLYLHTPGACGCPIPSHPRCLWLSYYLTPQVPMSVLSSHNPGTCVCQFLWRYQV